MRVNTEELSSTKKKLTIAAVTEDLETFKSMALAHLAPKVKVAGFRQGKAPLSMVEKYVNQQQLLDEFMGHAINDLYAKVVVDQKLRTIATPKIDVKKFVPFSQLEFTAEVDVLGAIILPDYKKIRVSPKTVVVSEKEVDDVIINLQHRAATRKEVKRVSKNGDELIIDFKGTDPEGKPIAGADAKGYPLLLGSNSFIPGFEENLIGVKAGTKKAFSVSFPKNYRVDTLAGKKAEFEVTINIVNELDEPKVDAKFASLAGPFKTVKELRDDIKKQLLSEKQTQANKQTEDELITKLLEGAKIDIPESLIEEQLNRLEEEEKRNLAYQGQTWQEHLEAEGVSPQQHRERFKPEAEKRVKAGLALSEVSEKENIEVSDKELEDRLRLLKQQYKDPAMQAELDKPESKRELMGRMISEKTIARLLDYSLQR